MRQLQLMYLLPHPATVDPVPKHGIGAIPTTPRALSHFVTAVVLAASCGACAQLIGSDSYTIRLRNKEKDSGTLAKASPKTDSGVVSSDASADAPAAPAPPFPTAPGCTSCLASGCAAEQEACTADGLCNAVWSDLLKSPSDANATYARALRTAAASKTYFESREMIHSPWQDLRTCTQDRCRDVCRTGEDFSCVGHFEWNVMAPKAASALLLDAATAQPLPTTTVKACRVNDFACDHPAQTTDSDANGFVQLSSLDAIPAGERIGYLSLQSSSAFRRWAAVVSRPLTDGDFGVWTIPADDAVVGVYQALGGMDDRSKAVFMVTPSDCSAFSAKNVKMEIVYETQQGLVLCGDCGYAYPNDDNKPLTSIQGFVTSGGQDGAIGNVLANSMFLRLRSIVDGSIVSVMSLTANAGWGYRIRMYPASSMELDAARVAGALTR